MAGHAWQQSGLGSKNFRRWGGVGSQAVSATDLSLIPSAWMDTEGSLSDLRRHPLCRNVYESMEQYTKVELLEGENQYKAEGFGMQVTLALACCVGSSLQVGCRIKHCT